MENENLYIDYLNEEESPNMGCSHPLSIVASDGKTYILKNYMVKYTGENNYEKQDAEFFQEELVSDLAKKLNIPTPNYVIITIDKETLETFSALRWTYHFGEGKYFATEKIENTENDLVKIFELATKFQEPYVITKWHNIFKSIINKEVIPYILCLDFLTMNFDRFTNSGNLLFQIKDNGKILVSIDYGFCFFNPYWDYDAFQGPYTKAQLLQTNKLINPEIEAKRYAADTAQKYLIRSAISVQKERWGYGIVFDSLQNELSFKKENPFIHAIRDIESISDETILNIIKEIPIEWTPGESIQREAYAGFLLRQRFLVRHIIDYTASQNLFTNCTGGQLEWQKEKNTSSL